MINYHCYFNIGMLGGGGGLSNIFDTQLCNSVGRMCLAISQNRLCYKKYSRAALLCVKW